jgi:hypothetical protein
LQKCELLSSSIGLLTLIMPTAKPGSKAGTSQPASWLDLSNLPQNASGREMLDQIALHNQQDALEAVKVLVKDNTAFRFLLHVTLNKTITVDEESTISQPAPASWMNVLYLPQDAPGRAMLEKIAQHSQQNVLDAVKFW